MKIFYFESIERKLLDTYVEKILFDEINLDFLYYLLIFN
jgi:hypothetical protein